MEKLSARSSLPQIRIGVAHKQMHDGVLEKVMLDFIEKRLDVLLVHQRSSRSGIDIPRRPTR